MAEQFFDPFAAPTAPAGTPATGGEVFDPFAGAGEASDKPGALSAFGRGVAESAVGLVGDFARFTGTTADALGDWLEERVPLGVVDVGADGISWRPSTPADIAGKDKMMAAVTERLSNPDFGYKPVTTWDDVKDRPLANILPFALEQGIVSIPHMAAVMVNLPAYVAARTGGIGQTRAENDRRAEATVEDFVKAAPAAVASALLERLGTKGILGLDDTVRVLKDIPGAAAKAGVKEAATEAGQEAIEYTGETLGTAEPFEFAEMADRSAAGAVAGGPFGAGVRAGVGGVEVAMNREAQPKPAVVTRSGEQPRDDGFFDPFAEASETAQAPTSGRPTEDLIAEEVARRQPAMDLTDEVEEPLDLTEIVTPATPAESQRMLASGAPADQVDAFLTGNGIPASGTRVSVYRAGRGAISGTIEDGFLGDMQSPDSHGVVLRMDDGRSIAVTLGELRDSGIAIAPLRALPGPPTQGRNMLPPPMRSGATSTYGDGFTMRGDEQPQRALSSPQMLTPKGFIPGAGFIAQEPGAKPSRTVKNSRGEPFRYERPAVSEASAAPAASSPPPQERVAQEPPAAGIAPPVPAAPALAEIGEDNRGWKVKIGNAIYRGDGGRPFRSLDEAAAFAGRRGAAVKEDLAPEPVQPGRRAVGLAEAIARDGGITDPGGELRSLDMQNWHRGRVGMPRLVVPEERQEADMIGGVRRVSTRSPDYRREWAIERGYLPPDATLSDLFDALAENRPTLESQIATNDRERMAEAARQQRGAVEGIRAEASMRGLDLDDGQVAQALAMMSDGLTAEEAVIDVVERDSLAWLDASGRPAEEIEGGQEFDIPFTDVAAAAAPGRNGDSPPRGNAGEPDARTASGGAAARAEPGASEPARASEPASDLIDTLDGPRQQSVIPGAERRPDRELAERQMAAPKRPATPQKGLEGLGIFDPQARPDAQPDLLSQPTNRNLDDGDEPVRDEADFEAKLRQTRYTDAPAARATDGNSYRIKREGDGYIAMRMPQKRGEPPRYFRTDAGGTWTEDQAVAHAMKEADQAAPGHKPSRSDPAEPVDPRRRAYDEGLAGRRFPADVERNDTHRAAYDAGLAGRRFPQAGETVEQEADRSRPPPGQGQSYAAGFTAQREGQARVLPSYFTKPRGKNAKEWLRGWDEAAAQKPGPREIGHNFDGNPVYEDDRGVRSYVREGVRITEAVQVRPDGGIAIDSSRRGPEFKTTMESGTVDQPQPMETGDAGGIEPLGRTGQEPLEDVSAEAVRSAEGGRDAGSRGARRRDDDARPDEPVAEPGRNVRGGLGSGEADLSVPARGAGDRGGDARQRGLFGRADHGGPRAEGLNQAPPPASPGTAVSINRAINDPESQRDGRNELPGVTAPQPTNYIITASDRLGEGGAAEKFRDNLAAIRLVKQIEAEKRRATADEQAVLVRYVGWGGLKSAFAKSDGSYNKGWEQKGRDLRSLLSEDEYRTAMRSVLDAHFTSAEVVQAIHDIVIRAGFRGGKVLEPSMGTGNFFGLMPLEIRSRSEMTGVELDRITGSIAKQLYQSFNILAPTGFQEAPLADGYFDVAIGNPPFGVQRVPGAKERDIKGFSIHNYFFARTINKLRPGGIMALVVTHRFLDKPGGRERDYIADRARFIGAIRLPNTAFQKNAMTEVTTDIVILQKLPDAEIGKADRTWTEVGSIPDPLGGEAIPLNSYFVESPDMMLGRMDRSGSMRQANEPTLAPDGRDLATALSEAVAKLPADIFTPSSTSRPTREMVAASAGAEESATEYEVGAFYMDGDKLMRREESPDGAPRAVSLSPATQWTEKTALGEGRFQRIVGMVKVRDAARNLLRLEAGNAPDSAVERARAVLNRVYDGFVAKHGYLNDRANDSLFKDDPDAPLLTALEKGYESGVSAQRARTLGVPPRKSTAGKMAIFKQRVIPRYEPVTKADNPKDALAITLAERGRVDLEHMAELTGKPVGDITRALHDDLDEPLIFRAPETNTWETASYYLSGNVKAKAKAAAMAGLHKNADALRAVFPPDKKAGDIRVRAGAPWVDPKFYEDFAAHLFGQGTQARISYLAATGGFYVSIRPGVSARADSTWGTSRLPGDDLLSRILNGKEIVVRDKDSEGKARVNADATLAAQEKAQAIREEFDEWIMRDADRREALARHFNDNLNTNIAPRFDGKHMTLPGKVPDAIIKMRRHQRDAIWRGVQQRTALLDHVVGAGKTFTIIATAMELRRIGLSKKPMIVVPNHLVEQWAADFYRLYPGARILTMTKKDFEARNRRRMLARIATGDWDSVITAHSSFGFIKVDPALERDFLQQQIADLQAAVDTVREEEGKKSRRVADFVRAQERLSAKLQDLADKPRDDMLTFEELGVDQLFIDEAHEFKNLFFTTSRRGMLGLGNPKGSKKAFDMFIKTQHLLRKQDGKGVIFATGTPVSNSLSEMYTIQRYLGLPALERLDIKSFDAWLNTFGLDSTDYELDGTGVKLKQVNRLRRLTNMTQIMPMYQQYADSVTIDQIKEAYREENPGQEFPIPKMKGGKRENVIVPRSSDQSAYFAEIVERAQNIRPGGKDNMLAITTDARKAALDMRLISPGYAENPDGKTDEAASRIVDIWRRWEADRGTQLVFLDLSVPLSAAKKEGKALRERLAQIADESLALDRLERAGAADLEIAAAEQRVAELEEALSKDYSEDDITAMRSVESGFSVYDDLKAKLMQRGIPEKEMAFIHDYATDEKKADLFEQVNAGRIRVLMGSTPKMGAGTNVQKRIVALHHIDCPWRPSDIEQREGRAIRQGNDLLEKYGDKFEVEVIAYATEQTYDSRMWQSQELKLIGIEGLRNYRGEDEMEEVAAAAATAAEMKAAATGNPLILEDVKLADDIRKMEVQQRNHRRQQYDLEEQKRRYERVLSDLPAKISAMEEDAKAARAYQRDPFAGNPPTGTVDGTTYSSHADAAKAAAASVERQSEGAEEGTRPRYEVEINGQKLTSRDAINLAIIERWGDATPFTAKIGRKTYIRRTEFATAVADDLETKGSTSMEVGGFAAAVEKTAGIFTTELHVSLEGQTVQTASAHADKDETVMGMARFAVKMLRELLDDMVSQPILARQRIETAKKELPEIDAQLSKEWGRDEELAARRARQAEVRRLLSAPPGRPAATATTHQGPDQQSGPSDSGRKFSLARPGRVPLSELAAKPPIRIVEARSRYAHLAPPAARRQARADALTTLRGVYQNADTGWQIELSAPGVAKSLSGDASAVRAEIVANLPDLIELAVLVESNSDRRGRGGIIHHRLYAPLLLDGRLNRIKLTVREYADGGRRHYAVDFAEIAEPEGYTASGGDVAEQSRTMATVRPAAPTGSTIKVVELLRGVKFDDGTPVLTEAGPRQSLRLKAEVREQLPAIATDLRQRMADLGISERVALRLAERIEYEWDGTAVDVDGVYTPEGRLIEVALSGQDAKWTLDHEIIHALRDLGLFTDPEWQALERAARADKARMAEIRREYAGTGLNEEGMVEEAIADMFADWATGRTRAGGFLRKAFETIRDLLRALRLAFRTRGYRNVTDIYAQDVFARVAGGEVGRRSGNGPSGERQPRFAKAWHGSPHEFDAFTAEKIGTGEGVQAYGWGLYFAGKKGVAEFYREKLSSKYAVNQGQAVEDVEQAVAEHRRESAQEGFEAFSSSYTISNFLTESLDLVATDIDGRDVFAMVDGIIEPSVDGKTFRVRPREQEGRLYKVELAPAEDEYLLWDRPLAEQSEKVLEALERQVETDRSRGRESAAGKVIATALESGAWGGAELYQALAGETSSPPRGAAGQRQASELLAALGIPGIKYLDGGSRRRGDGSYNYVLFDQSLVRIEQKFSIARSTPGTDTEREAKRATEGVARRTIDFIRKTARLAASPLGNLPEQRAYMVSRYKAMGEIARIEEIAKHLNTAFSGAIRADQDAAYTYLTTKDASPDEIADAVVRGAAVQAKKLVDDVGRALVKRGLLPREAYEENKGSYLPRIYLRHLLGGDIRTAGGGKVSDLGYLKKRKDIPQDVRAVILGEITDPGFLTSRAYGQPMRDMVVLDLLQEIAGNRDWIFAESLVDWDGRQVSALWLKGEAERIKAQIPYMRDAEWVEAAKALVAKMDDLADPAIEASGKAPADYVRVPESKRYGSLAGMLVRKEIHSDLIGAIRILQGEESLPQRILGDRGIATKATQWWKFSKVALNYPTQARNFVSNAVLLHLSGVPLHRVPQRMVQAIGEIRGNGKHYQVAKRFGITGSTFAHSELRQIQTDFLRVQARDGHPWAKIKAMGGSFLQFHGDLYQLSETIFKTAKIIDGMEREGKTPEDAALEAHRSLFDYSLVGPGVRYLRNAPVGIPFITFYAKALPFLVETARKRPLKALPYLALPYLASAWLQDLYDVDDDDLEALKMALPEWLRERGNVYLLPFKDEEGRWQAVNIGYFFPWTMYFDFAKDVVNLEPGDAISTAGLLGGPLPDLLAAIKTNIDPFTNKQIVDERDPPAQQVASLMSYVWRLGAPSYLTDMGFVGHLTRTLTGAVDPKTGEPTLDEFQAVARLTGFNVYPIQPRKTRAANIRWMEYEIDQVERRMKEVLRDRNLSPEERREVRIEFVDLIRNRQQALREYAEASRIHPNLE